MHLDFDDGKLVNLNVIPGGHVFNYSYDTDLKEL